MGTFTLSCIFRVTHKGSITALLLVEFWAALLDCLQVISTPRSAWRVPPAHDGWMRSTRSRKGPRKKTESKLSVSTLKALSFKTPEFLMGKKYLALDTRAQLLTFWSQNISASFSCQISSGSFRVCTNRSELLKQDVNMWDIKTQMETKVNKIKIMTCSYMKSTEN